MIQSYLLQFNSISEHTHMYTCAYARAHTQYAHPCIFSPRDFLYLDSLAPVNFQRKLHKTDSNYKRASMEESAKN